MKDQLILNIWTMAGIGDWDCTCSIRIRSLSSLSLSKRSLSSFCLSISSLWRSRSRFSRSSRSRNRRTRSRSRRSRSAISRRLKKKIPHLRTLGQYIKHTCTLNLINVFQVCAVLDYLRNSTALRTRSTRAMRSRILCSFIFSKGRMPSPLLKKGRCLSFIISNWRGKNSFKRNK